MYHQHTICRACGGTDLVEVLNLGIQPLANNFVHPGEECAGYAPLSVLFCKTCTLAQLSVVVDPAVLYSRYSYVTSKSEMMRSHFEDILDDILAECGKPPKTLLEIGSNDGTFLKFAQSKFKGEVLGFEPADNLADTAEKWGIPTVNKLFTHANAIQLSARPFKADVIVARHVFCHIDDWRGFIRGLEVVSDKDTLVFIEVPHVLDMFKMNSFDQIYHEHLSYMSTTAMIRLLRGTKFVLHKVMHYPIHGGAVGIMLRRGCYPGSVPEGESSLYEQWLDLASFAENGKSRLREMITGLREEGKKVCGFGASAKATVWINACGFTRENIAYVCDSTPEKQHCLVPGTNIPVVSEGCLAKADCAVLFAWNFAQEIMEKNKAFTDKGGKWIIPCPEVRMLS